MFPIYVFCSIYVLSGTEAHVDPDRVGIVGHSFGGWTALAAPDVEPRIRAIVALAPGGGSNPKPGILPLKLTFRWGRDIPTLYLVAENDVPLPLDGINELFERTPSAKRDGHLASGRPLPLPGQCRGGPRDGAGHDVSPGPRLDDGGDAAHIGTLFRGTGTPIRASTHALPHGCRLKRPGGSTAVLGW